MHKKGIDRKHGWPDTNIVYLVKLVWLWAAVHPSVRAARRHTVRTLSSILLSSRIGKRRERRRGGRRESRGVERYKVGKGGTRRRRGEMGGEEGYGERKEKRWMRTGDRRLFDTGWAEKTTLIALLHWLPAKKPCISSWEYSAPLIFTLCFCCLTGSHMKYMEMYVTAGVHANRQGATVAGVNNNLLTSYTVSSMSRKAQRYANNHWVDCLSIFPWI